MKFHLRIDEINPSHVHCTLFVNNANCGRLTFRIEEFCVFRRIMLSGTKEEGITIELDDARTACMRYINLIEKDNLEPDEWFLIDPGMPYK